MSFFASQTFTLLHTALSLIGIVAGLVALFGLFRNNPLNSWTLVFLVTTVATTLTGFLFPFRGFTPVRAIEGASKDPNFSLPRSIPLAQATTGVTCSARWPSGTGNVHAGPSCATFFVVI